MDAEELQRLRFDVGELMRSGMNIQLTPQTASALLAHIDTVTARAEAAEAQALQLRLDLGAQVERANRLAIWADRYGADQWRRGNAGQEPHEFAEWQQEVAAWR